MSALFLPVCVALAAAGTTTPVRALGAGWEHNMGIGVLEIQRPGTVAGTVAVYKGTRPNPAVPLGTDRGIARLEKAKTTYDFSSIAYAAFSNYNWIAEILETGEILTHSTHFTVSNQGGALRVTLAAAPEAAAGKGVGRTLALYASNAVELKAAAANAFVREQIVLGDLYWCVASGASVTATTVSVLGRSGVN